MDNYVLGPGSAPVVQRVSATSRRMPRAGVTHQGCYLPTTSHGNRWTEHHQRSRTLRNPHLDTHLLLPTTRSPMPNPPNPPLAPKITRFCIPANRSNTASYIFYSVSINVMLIISIMNIACQNSPD